MILVAPKDSSNYRKPTKYLVILKVGKIMMLLSSDELVIRILRLEAILALMVIRIIQKETNGSEPIKKGMWSHLGECIRAL